MLGGRRDRGHTAWPPNPTAGAAKGGRTYHHMMLAREKNTSLALSSHPVLQGGASRKRRRNVRSTRRGK